jgi:flavodoxin I
MTSLVVFESFFGNTEMVARAVAEALQAGGKARALRVSEIEKHHLDGVGLLVVGSATRAFSPSPGTQAWLKTLPSGKLAGVRVAAFDTRVDPTTVENRLVRWMMQRFGYAAEPIEKALVRGGGEKAGPAAGFIVEDKEGPLREGETDRARAWARGLVSG